MKSESVMNYKIFDPRRSQVDETRHKMECLSVGKEMIWLCLYLGRRKGGSKRMQHVLHLKDDTHIPGL